MSVRYSWLNLETFIDKSLQTVPIVWFCLLSIKTSMKIDSSCLEQYMFRSLHSLHKIWSVIHINEAPALDSVRVCSKSYPKMLILVVKELFFLWFYFQIYKQFIVCQCVELHKIYLGVWHWHQFDWSRFCLGHQCHSNHSLWDFDRSKSYFACLKRDIKF